MQLIHSNVPPLNLEDGSITLAQYFESKIQTADRLVCLVGYASKKSLMEIDSLVRKYGIKNVTIVLGMYCIEGFPESIYNTATSLNDDWVQEGIGEIRATKSMKYHGKVYAFYRGELPFSVAIGSHNLGPLVSEPNNLRQYEISISTEDQKDCLEIHNHISKVITSPISENLASISNVRIIREQNSKLNGVESVSKVSSEDIKNYKDSLTDISFEIPLKVPGIPDSSDDFMRSNINKCYAKGRLNSKTGEVTERGWWETEIIVGKKTTSNPDYPEERTPFYVITDDGWKFKMHASGDHKKNFESEGDLKILGYWLKGRLVAAGIVEPVDSPSQDLEKQSPSLPDRYKHCRGVITYEKLKRYGRTSVTFTKTTKKIIEDGVCIDVWMLSFLPL